MVLLEDYIIVIMPASPAILCIRAVIQSLTMNYEL